MVQDERVEVMAKKDRYDLLARWLTGQGWWMAEMERYSMLESGIPDALQ